MEKVKGLLQNKKVIIGIIAAVVAIIAIIFCLNLSSKDKEEIEIARKFDLNKPIVIQKDGKYGYIDTKGNVMIEPQYKSANQFYGDFALVKTEDLKYKVINKKGEELASSDSVLGISHISDSDYWVIDAKLYDDNMKQVSKEGVAVSYSSTNDGYLTFIDSNKKVTGVMNSKGKVTFEMPITEGELLSLTSANNFDDLKDTYCTISINSKKYAIINCESGKVIYDLAERYITTKDNNVFVIKQGDYKSEPLETIYIEDDKVAYKVENHKDITYYKKDVLRIEKDSSDYTDRYNYYDLKNKTMLAERPTLEEVDPWELLTGFTLFECTNGVGLMKDEKVILSCEWDDINYFSDDLYKYLEADGKEYILLDKDSKIQLYNMKNNKVVTTFNTTYLYDYSGSTFIKYSDKDTKEVILYNLMTEKSLNFEKGTTVNIFSNYITIKKDGKTTYYNAELEKIYEV